MVINIRSPELTHLIFGSLFPLIIFTYFLPQETISPFSKNSGFFNEHMRDYTVFVFLCLTCVT